MKKDGGGKSAPGKLQAAIDMRPSASYDKVPSAADFIAAGTTQFGSGWAWLSVKNGKLEISQDPERREPGERSRRIADSRRRRLGTLLLHRLPQRPSEVSRSLRRQPDQLGLRAGNVRSRSEVRRFELTFQNPPRPARRFFFVDCDSFMHQYANNSDHSVHFLKTNPFFRGKALFLLKAGAA